jgi:hypothetical protein
MPEKILVYDPKVTNGGRAFDKAIALGCTMYVRGLAPWMVANGNIVFGQDGYVAVLVCEVPEHNARHEVLATFADGNLTAANIAAVVDHAMPAPEVDMATRIRNVDTSTITDTATRTVFDRLKEALEG